MRVNDWMIEDVEINCFKDEFFHGEDVYISQMIFKAIYEKQPKRLMQKPLLERSHVKKCCRNHGKRYSELPKAITWFDGEVESCCCFSQPFGITSCNLVCIVLIFVTCESSGSQKACRCSQKADSCSKRPRARPKV